MTGSATAAQQRYTEDYARLVARAAYVWGWPLVNMHNRRSSMNQLPAPGLLGGIAPVAPPGRLAMLHDYVEPAERLVACPNQDVAYGFGLLAADAGPSVIQVPDLGDRFWVCQMVDQRTESFGQLGAMYRSPPGYYLMAPAHWHGDVPSAIRAVFRYDTAVGVVIPRLFMDDTDADRAAILSLVNQISMYPLAEFTGEMRQVEWQSAQVYGDASAATGGAETIWVNPDAYFSDLGTVLDEVPPRPGEQALYDWFRGLLSAAESDPAIASAVKQAALEADDVLDELFEFRNYGIPLPHHWTTQRSGAAFGTDYLMRAAVAKSNIFVNTVNETSYFYQDFDAAGERLEGSNSYRVHFDAGQLPPVTGFWSLTVYNEQHFFHPNELARYSLGTKNKSLTFGHDGSLTLVVGGTRPDDEDLGNNWLPAPTGAFSLYLRAYWPGSAILDGSWTPPPVQRAES